MVRSTALLSASQSELMILRRWLNGWTDVKSPVAGDRDGLHKASV